MQNLNYKSLGDWPPGIKWVAVLASCLLVFVVGYGLLISDLAQQLTTTEEQQAILKQSLLAKQQTIKKLPVLHKQVQALQLSLATQLNSEIDAVTALGIQVGMHFNTVKLLPEQTVNNFIVLPVQLNLTNHYQQISQFITLLAQAKPLIGIQGFAIGEHETELIATVYHSLEANSKLLINTNQTNEVVAAKPADPFHPAVVDTIENFPLHLLHMVGFIQQDQTSWALIAAPDNKVYSVVVGARLDTDGKVVAIDAEKITIAKVNKTITLTLVNKQ